MANKLSSDRWTDLSRVVTLVDDWWSDRPSYSCFRTLMISPRNYIRQKCARNCRLTVILVYINIYIYIYSSSTGHRQVLTRFSWNGWQEQKSLKRLHAKVPNITWYEQGRLTKLYYSPALFCSDREALFTCFCTLSRRLRTSRHRISSFILCNWCYGAVTCSVTWHSIIIKNQKSSIGIVIS